jgi:hypothetical protein
MDNRRFRCCEQVFAISELVIWKWAAGSVRPGRPAGTLCGPFARPRTVSSAARELSRPPGERGVKWARWPATPPGMRSAAGRRPAARSAGRATDLRLYRLEGHNRQHLRPAGVARFPYGRRMFPAGCHAFPPAGRDVSRRWAPHVSAGVPQRFRWGAAGFPPGTVAFRREGGRRAAARYRRGRPDGPGAGDRRRPLPSRVIHFADGRIRRDDRAVRPAGGQPLTSGPARVRLIRRMTRRSRSMAAR